MSANRKLKREQKKEKKHNDALLVSDQKASYRERLIREKLREGQGIIIHEKVSLQIGDSVSFGMAHARTIKPKIQTPIEVEAERRKRND